MSGPSLGKPTNRLLRSLPLTYWILMLLLLSSLLPPSIAQSPIALKFQFLGVDVEGDRRFSIPFELVNLSGERQVVHLVIDAPEGWFAQVRDRTFGITILALEPKERASLELMLDPEEDLKPGKYTITLKVLDQLGNELSSVGIQANFRKGRPGAGGVELKTSFPVLKGPSGTTFVYSLDVKNDSPDELSFDLSALGPSGWRVAFKPAFEDKQISTLRLRAGEEKGLDVQLFPPPNVQPGTYNFTIRASAGEISGSIDLQAVVTGTFEIGLRTADERLNLGAIAGQEESLTLIVENEGTARLRDISFSSIKPSGWEVEFEPNSIEELRPGNSREVIARIKTPNDAIAGDYSLTLSASTDEASEDLELRVTVSTSPTFGLVGIGIVAIAILAMVLAFMRLGRR